ncbi:PilZ domain-containing protein [Allorhizobium terrae]|uniref:PilZ domain-containing protein n=1 Tax=Allorhizobium terrae TaxID=1848972 RepID=A0A4S4A2A2_9HYPH|nr:PilZ domain-containing protein [Allorhizobium terrae]THF52506.1 PilZ domain-containing protein [Allorhizobium terrae]TWD46942.1 PilZ domain-containing protein [Agrobacterium vitis]
MESGNHLRGVTSEMYERRWDRFQVKRPARIMAVRSGLSGTVSRSATVLDISRGGAGIEIDGTMGLGSHYYLEILGLGTRIGCAEAFRKGNRAGVKFILPISETLLQRVVRADFMMGNNLDDVGKSVLPGMGRLAR